MLGGCWVGEQKVCMANQVGGLAVGWVEGLIINQVHRAWPGSDQCWPVWAASTCSGWPGAPAEV